MHLEERYLNMVLEILKKYVPEYDIWLFGSRVHGRNLKKASDIDLCVKTLDKPLPLELYGKIKTAFDDSDLPYFVDVVDWTTASDTFKQIIEREYEVIQKGNI